MFHVEHEPAYGVMIEERLYLLLFKEHFIQRANCRLK